ncbi:hypothetical protein QBZ16_000161 [Prototheca wickerhamii]|uniref:PPPDE domain-containing protein n=1 Tax=Prototheca wickerhamii TaxID=3111 RepID=A0AAD9IMC8_PROWI|nr:hypothetical protein QBZ16_000161 [Prototheca wickerhamii]
MPGAAVYLNVYDLIDHNDWTYWCGIGVFHSGVEVYGVEYAYGGHEYDAPGVFATNPRQAPGTVTFREAILLGETSLSARQVYAVVQELGQEFRGNAYHLLQQNCNTFSDALCYRLTGEHAPPWVNRLANFAVALHCLLPQGWVPPLRPPKAEEQRLLGEMDGAVHLPSEGAAEQGGSIAAALQARETVPGSSASSLGAAKPLVA